MIGVQFKVTGELWEVIAESYDGKVAYARRVNRGWDAGWPRSNFVGGRLIGDVMRVTVSLVKEKKE